MKKQQVFFIHGGSAYSEYDNFLNGLRNKALWSPTGEVSKKWSLTLREDLGGEYELFALQMPNKQNAKYEEWKIWFERHFVYMHDDVVLLGWSLGGMFLTKYLIENEVSNRVKKLLLIASVWGGGSLNIEGGEDCGDFEYDIEKVDGLAQKVETIVIMYSKDDFVVPYEHALKYKEALPEAELVTFEDKNHFLITEFPELIEMIKEVG